jgi:hypothetical protein
LDFEYFSAGNSGGLGPREHGPAGPSVHHGPKMEVQEQFSPELHQAAVPVGKLLLRIGGNWEGGILMLTEGETCRGSCRESQAAVKYRLDGQSSSRRWLRARKAEIDWGNVVWGEARCCFIGAWTSGGVRVAINW